MSSANNEQLIELVSNAQMAFLNGKLQEAFSLAKEAIKLDPECADAYQCAANVCMSLSRYEDAIEYYSQAVRCEPDNGNRYFNLGYAQASVNKIADTMQSFAKADELGLSEDAAGQMYHILGIVNQQLGKLDDALINLKKSETLVPADIDIMKRKAVIYGIKDDISNGLNVANQMKLFAPSDYSGYQVAYILLKQANRMEDAFKELVYARRNLMNFPFDLCSDMINFELTAYQKDHDPNRFQRALTYIKHYLKAEKPTQQEVMESYVEAAELYLQLNDADNVLMCLKAAENPVFSYNNGVLYYEYQPEQADANSILNEMNANLYRYEQLSTEQLETMRNNGTYLTPIGSDDSESGEYKLADEKIVIILENKDRINRLYVGAYTLKEDFRKVMYYALELQKSQQEYLVELGWYTEAKAMKDMKLDGWHEKYAEVQKKLRNAILKDPSDLNAMTLRVRCLIDTEQYDEAKEKCSYLKKELQEPLLEEINKAKNGGA